LPEVAPGSPSAAMYCGSMRLNFERSAPDACCSRLAANMRDPMDRSQRLSDGTRWRIFMRLLRLDDLMTSYTNARPGVGLLVVDLDLGTASVRP
jgi:hypothetical protein